MPDKTRCAHAKDALWSATEGCLIQDDMFVKLIDDAEERGYPYPVLLAAVNRWRWAWALTS